MLSNSYWRVGSSTIFGTVDCTCAYVGLVHVWYGYEITYLFQFCL